MKVNNNRYVPKMIPENKIPKYKIVVINEKELVDVLEKEFDAGYEPVRWLDAINPNAQSDFKGWKILMGRK